MIENIDFSLLESEKYWSFPKTYKGDQASEVRNMIFSGDYLGAIKKNGHYFRFIKDKGVRLQSRSENVDGIFLDKIGHVPHLMSFFNNLPDGTVLLGEIYFPNNPGSKVVTTIMGCLEAKAIDRQKKGEYLHYYIFDVWAYAGESFLNKTAENRFNFLKNIPLNNNPYVEVAEYKRGQDLFDLLSFARETGEEGIVMTKANSLPEPGKRTSRKTLKVKQELDNPIDVFFTGKYKPATRSYTGKEIEKWMYWLDLKTDEKVYGELYEDYARGRTIEPITKGFYFGWAGSLEIGAYDANTSEIISIGYLSGLGDNVKQGIVEDPDKWIMKVMKVNAMKIDEKSGKLQHGKCIEFRDDINWKDCTVDKIYG